ncbi:MAG: hypothetical protein HIU89_10440 [Proteobacteria bacterium]|nr:hypothetical protein [Pseudomonadota bacterium]
MAPTSPTPGIAHPNSEALAAGAIFDTGVPDIDVLVLGLAARLALHPEQAR